MTISILNDVIGPVMRGPSSSHTAGPFFIGKAVRTILGSPPREAEVLFDPAGSFARVYRDQKSDVGFAAGLLGMSITEAGFTRSLERARRGGVRIAFATKRLRFGDHPNAVQVEARAAGGRKLVLAASSIGGGRIRIDGVDGVPVAHDGQRARLLLLASGRGAEAPKARALRPHAGAQVHPNAADPSGRSVLCEGEGEALARLAARVRACGGWHAWLLPATGLPVRRAPRAALDSIRDIERLVGGNRATPALWRVGMEYEAEILALSHEQVAGHMLHRWRVMESAIEGGLHGRPAMRLLKPSARKLLCAGRKGKRLCGGILGDACAAALAVMETDSAGGVVCAAPTGGSAGVLPGALWAASRRRRWPRRRVVEALFAAGVVGAMVSSRATFAAEVCGCAAETGVAAAMAAAALAELAGADWRACLDAACLCLMNTLGLVCDPVQGAVEIPCHARNLGAVGQALVAVEAVLGGFRPMLPLDEVIDCMLAVGRQLPASLRCTGLGGLAATPTGKQL